MVKSNDLGTAQALNTIIVKELVKGRSFEQISEKLGIPVTEVVSEWQKYVSERNTMPWEEQWLLHLLRLEKLLDTAWDVLQGDMDSDSILAVAKVLEKIEELQSLNISRKEKLQSDMIQLNKAQVSLMLQGFAVLGENLKEHITHALGNKTIKAIKGELVEDFDAKFRTFTKESLKEIANES